MGYHKLQSKLTAKVYANAALNRRLTKSYSSYEEVKNMLCGGAAKDTKQRKRSGRR